MTAHRLKPPCMKVGTPWSFLRMTVWHHRAHGHAEIVADGLATAATVANPIGAVPSSSWCCDRPSENEDIYISRLVELPQDVQAQRQSDAIPRVYATVRIATHSAKTFRQNGNEPRTGVGVIEACLNEQRCSVNETTRPIACCRAGTKVKGGFITIWVALDRASICVNAQPGRRWGKTQAHVLHWKVGDRHAPPDRRQDQAGLGCGHKSRLDIAPGQDSPPRVDCRRNWPRPGRHAHKR